MRIKTLTAVFLVIITWSLAFTAFSQTSPTTPLTIVEKKIIFGIWVDARGRSFVSHKGSQDLIAALKKYSFNAMFLQVRQNADAFYLSASEPRSPKIEADYLDPLSDLIMLSRSLATGEQPLAVYPWFDILVAHNAREEAFPAENSVMKKQPQWLSKDVKGDEVDENNIYMLDPAIPEVQDYLIEVVLEVVKKYNIDGVYLDSLYYLNKNWGYNPLSLQMFKKEFNRNTNPVPDDPDWCEWRRQQLNRFVKLLQIRIKQAEPDVELLIGATSKGSPPSSPEDFKNTFAYKEALQDWPTWAQQGWVDAICLLDFRSEYAQPAEFDKWLQFAISVKGKANIYAGIGGFLNFTNETVRQISRAKQLEADGVVIYSYSQPSRDEREFALDAASKAATTPGFLLLPRAPIPEIEMPVVATPAVPTTPTLEVAVTSPTLEVKITSPTLEAEISTPSIAMATPVPTPEPTVAPTVTPVPTPTATPPPPLHTIYLTNGSVIEGRILSQFKDKVIVETVQGVRLRLSREEILRVEKKE